MKCGLTLLAVVLLGAALDLLISPTPAPAFILGQACGQRTVRSPSGIVFRIDFARNGAVQRYEVLHGRANMEAVNDARMDLEHTYGPAGVNAPPVRIVKYKTASSGGMMLPAKAIDSCGRSISFNS